MVCSRYYNNVKYIAIVLQTRYNMKCLNVRYRNFSMFHHRNKIKHYPKIQLVLKRKKGYQILNIKCSNINVIGTQILTLLLTKRLNYLV